MSDDKKNEHTDIKYASFNRRMMAATIDSVIALFTLEPLVDMVLDIFKKPETAAESGVTFDRLSQQLATQTDPAAQTQALHQMLVDSAPQVADMAGNYFAQTAIFIIVSMICWKLWAATPGKLLMRMKIVDADSEAPMTDRQIVVRGLGYIPSAACLFLGFFWIGLDKRRQGWHDKYANTVVINVKKPIK